VSQLPAGSSMSFKPMGAGPLSRGALPVGTTLSFRPASTVQR
jgi:hypothetical protein